MGTRTGTFPIGFRRGWGEWQKKDLRALAGWAKAEGFEALDLGQPSREDLAVLKSAGLAIGTVDLLEFSALLSPDGGKRKAAVAKNAEYLRAQAEAGVRFFFTCVIPEDKEKPRLENYKLAVESFGALGRVAEGLGARIVIEGWPGGGGLPNLCCSPETCRALFKDAGTAGLGVNYDPSHLIRLGIDHVRFAEEFAERIGHVHGKDTELLGEAAYEFGLYQPSVFKKNHGFGEQVWRYTIPGHGCARWSRVFQILAAARYAGAVCVELEDENYNGSEAGEQAGLRAALGYLRTV